MSERPVYVVVYPCDGYGAGGDVIGVFADVAAVRRWYVSDDNPHERPDASRRKLPGYGGEFHPYTVAAHPIIGLSMRDKALKNP